MSTIYDIIKRIQWVQNHSNFFNEEKALDIMMSALNSYAKECKVQDQIQALPNEIGADELHGLKKRVSEVEGKAGSLEATQARRRRWYQI